MGRGCLLQRRADGNQDQLPAFWCWGGMAGVDNDNYTTLSDDLEHARLRGKGKGKVNPSPLHPSRALRLGCR